MQRSAIVIICRLSSVVVFLSVTRVYRDKTVEARIMQFSLKFSPMPYLCLPSLITNFEGGTFDRGAQTRVKWFLMEFATLYFGKGVRYSFIDDN